MQIGEVIRKYRKEKNMTQEEMAERLGVTPPAVNKWETGRSCPDIALLAPIARLLDITLDTLLSFRGELTEEELRRVIEELNIKLKNGDYEEAFRFAREQAARFPNSDQMAWQMAVVLDAQRLLQDIPDSERYDEFILSCYSRALESGSDDIRYRAADSLYSFYFRQKQYEQAEQYLAYFSGHDPERKRKQAQIYRKTGRTQEAYQILEELLFSYFQLVSASLHGLYMLSAEDGDLEQAHLLVKKEKLLARLFDMGEYYEASAGLDLAVLEKDEAEVLEAAEKMLSGIETIRSFTESPLYRHMDFRKAEEGFLAELKQNLLNCFRDEETYGFMRKNEKWKRLIETNGRLME